MKSDIPLCPSKFEKVFFFPDLHIPFHDPKAVSLSLTLLRHFGTHRVVILGDLIDGYGLSKFDADLSHPASKIKYELDAAFDFLSAVRRAAPKARIQIIHGNHDLRLQTFLLRHAPALSGLPNLSLGTLLRLKELKADPETLPSVSLASGSFLARHGTYTSLNAPKQEFLSALKSGITGHTHRASTFFHRANDAIYTHIECGHLSVNPPHYKENVQNWHQAIAFGEFSVSGHSFDVHLVPFRLTYQARFDGKVFSA